MRRSPKRPSNPILGIDERTMNLDIKDRDLSLRSYRENICLSTSPFIGRDFAGQCILRQSDRVRCIWSVREHSNSPPKGSLDSAHVRQGPINKSLKPYS